MNIFLASKYLYIYLLIYNGWKFVESTGAGRQYTVNHSSSHASAHSPELISVDVSYKGSSDKVTYEKNKSDNSESFTANNGYLINKVKNGGTVEWEAPAGNFARKLVLKTDSNGDPKLTLFYDQPVPVRRARGRTAFPTAGIPGTPVPGFATPGTPLYFGTPVIPPYYGAPPLGHPTAGPSGMPGYYPQAPHHMPSQFPAGPSVPSHSKHPSGTPVVTVSTPVMVVPKSGYRPEVTPENIRITDAHAGRNYVQFTVSTDSEDGDLTVVDGSNTRVQSFTRAGDTQSEVEVVEDHIGDDDPLLRDAAFVMGSDGKSGPKLPKPHAVHPTRHSASHTLSELSEMVQSLKKNEHNLLKRINLLEAENRNLKRGVGSGGVHKGVPSMVKHLNVTGDTKNVKMYTTDMAEDGEEGMFGTKLVLSVGDHSNVYFLDGNSNHMLVNQPGGVDLKTPDASGLGESDAERAMHGDDKGSDTDEYNVYVGAAHKTVDLRLPRSGTDAKMSQEDSDRIDVESDDEYVVEETRVHRSHGSAAPPAAPHQVPAAEAGKLRGAAPHHAGAPMASQVRGAAAPAAAAHMQAGPAGVNPAMGAPAHPGAQAHQNFAARPPGPNPAATQMRQVNPGQSVQSPALNQNQSMNSAMPNQHHGAPAMAPPSAARTATQASHQPPVHVNDPSMSDPSSMPIQVNDKQ